MAERDHTCANKIFRGSIPYAETFRYGVTLCHNGNTERHPYGLHNLKNNLNKKGPYTSKYLPKTWTGLHFWSICTFFINEFFFQKI